MKTKAGVQAHLARLARTRGADYGKPVPGSQSEQRSTAYQRSILEEVTSLILPACLAFSLSLRSNFYI